VQQPLIPTNIIVINSLTVKCRIFVSAVLVPTRPASHEFQLRA
jgi:hypothetical protein